MPTETPHGRAARGTRRRRAATVAVVVAAVAVVAPAVHYALPGGVAARDGHAGRPRPAASVPAVPPSTEPAAPPTAPGSSPAPTEPPLVDPDPATADPVAQPPAGAPAPAAPPASPPGADPAALSVDEQAAAALALVRYPWQRLPGYTIRFAPSTEAPAPDVGGMTTLTWGATGGATVVYVAPGESTATLAGVTAFEIGHEVDAAAVEPRGGHEEIEDVLGIHPTSWAPPCACDERGYLSGWYAAAFAAAWSPGVGAWSALAPLPSGPVAAAVARWLEPPIG